MIDAVNSAQNTYSTLTGLTYIETLISGATEQGLYSIQVRPEYLNNEAIERLRNEFGYRVTSRSILNNEYSNYTISWLPINSYIDDYVDDYFE
jgi:hypothetical protein